MNTNRKKQKYKILYEKIKKTYNEELLSIEKACSRHNITMTTYYNACKYLGYKTIPEFHNIEKEYNNYQNKKLEDENKKLFTENLILKKQINDKNLVVKYKI